MKTRMQLEQIVLSRLEAGLSPPEIEEWLPNNGHPVSPDDVTSAIADITARETLFLGALVNPKKLADIQIERSIVATYSALLGALEGYNGWASTKYLYRKQEGLSPRSKLPIYNNEGKRQLFTTRLLRLNRAGYVQKKDITKPEYMITELGKTAYRNLLSSMPQILALV